MCLIPLKIGKNKLYWIWQLIDYFKCNMCISEVEKLLVSIYIDCFKKNKNEHLHFDCNFVFFFPQLSEHNSSSNIA